LRFGTFLLKKGVHYVQEVQREAAIINYEKGEKIPLHFGKKLIEVSKRYDQKLH
jgi:hypothetical protein